MYVTSFTNPAGETKIFECDGFILINVKENEAGNYNSMTVQTSVSGLDYTQIARALISANAAVYNAAIKNGIDVTNGKGADTAGNTGEADSKPFDEDTHGEPNPLRKCKDWLACPTCGSSWFSA